MSKRKSGSRKRAETVAAKREIVLEPRRIAIGALLIALTLGVFWRAHGFDFVQWDDNENVTQNPLYQPLATSHLGELWTLPYYSAYIPITRLLWAFLAGTQTAPDGSTIAYFDPRVYHAANLAVHALNVLLVFLVVRLILKKTVNSPLEARVGQGSARLDWAAAFGAAVFAVHPLQVEPVAWVTGMKDVLCAFFSLLSLSLYLLHRSREEVGMASRLLLAGATLAYALAILSKSSAVVLPVIAVLIDWILACVSKSQVGSPQDQGLGDRKPASRFVFGIPLSRLAVLGAWLLAAIPVVVLTKHAEDLAGIRIPLVPVWQRPFVMGDTLAFYLWKTVDPSMLGPDYGRTPIWLMRHGWAYGMILIPLALGIAAVALRRRLPWLTIAFGIWLLSLLPVSGIMPFDFQAFSSVADRYMYFAMFGIALAAAGALAALPVRAAIPVGVIVICVLSVLSFLQVPVWTNTTTLFTQGLRVNPRSSVSYLSLGHEKQAKDLDGAIEDYRKAILYNPMAEQAHNNLGEALGQKWSSGDRSPSTLPLLTEAQAQLERAVALRDNFPDGHSNLGNVYYGEHRYADALAQFQAALRFDPENAQDAYMAGMICQQLGNVDQSRKYLQQASGEGFAPAEKALNGQ